MSQAALDLLTATLANSSAFQSFVNAANSTDATARIYSDVLPAPAAGEYTEAELLSLRPCALIHAHRTRRRRTSTCTGFEQSGQAVVCLMRTTPDDEPNNLKDIAFRGIGESIADDLQEDSYTEGRLNIWGMELAGPFRTTPTETAGQGDFQQYDITLDWGNQ